MTKHIAIVEDEAALRENYSQHLAKLGYQVETYADRYSAEFFSGACQIRILFFGAFHQSRKQRLNRQYHFFCKMLYVVQSYLYRLSL